MHSSDRSLDSAQILDDLRRIVRALRESSRLSESTLGVSGAQLFALKALDQASGGVGALSLNELAVRTRTHQSTLSTVVKRLVAGNWVKRVSSDDDARRVELTVTAKGRALLAKAPYAAQETLVRGVEDLAPEKRRSLATALHELVLAMRLGDEPVSMFFEDGARDAVPVLRPTKSARAPKRGAFKPSAIIKGRRA